MSKERECRGMPAMRRLGRLLLPIVLFLSGCASLEVQEEDPEEAAAVRAQVTVTTALLEAEEVNAAPVRVEYADGTVRLTGFVETEAERRDAGAIAREALPDHEIINALEVWGS